MKKITKQEIKEANRIAYSYLYGYKNLKWDTLPKLDMRFRISKLAVEIFKKNQLTDTIRSEVTWKRRNRNLNKPYYFISIMNNPLLLDFMKNRDHVEKIYYDHIWFCGRNHWAKSRKDLVILSVLQKMKY